MAKNQISLGPLEKVIRYDPATHGFLGLFDENGDPVYSAGEVLTFNTTGYLVAGAPVTMSERIDTTQYIAVRGMDIPTFVATYGAAGLDISVGAFALDTAGLLAPADTLVIWSGNPNDGVSYTLSPIMMMGSTIMLVIEDNQLMMDTDGFRLGQESANRGRLELWYGGTNEAGTIGFYTADGSGPFYLFVSNAGVLRIHNAVPTADGDGAAV